MLNKNQSRSPKLSVIMPVYNAEIYVEAALSSIINQSFKDFELILINDGSTDDSFKILKKHAAQDNRIVLIDRENKGLTHSLNEAISISKGEYLARMDADDISLPFRFEKQLDLMQRDSLDICGCHYFILNKENKYLDVFFAPLNIDSILLYLLQGVPFAHGSVIIRSSFLRENKLLYGSNRRFAEDKSLWYMMYNSGAKFGNLNEIAYQYREHKGSLLNKRNELIYNDHKIIKKELIYKHNKKVLFSITNLIYSLDNLSKREVEYLSDLIFDLIFSIKFKTIIMIKYFLKIPVRYQVISIIKKLRFYK